MGLPVSQHPTQRGPQRGELEDRPPLPALPPRATSGATPGSRDQFSGNTLHPGGHLPQQVPGPRLLPSPLEAWSLWAPQAAPPGPRLGQGQGQDP